MDEGLGRRGTETQRTRCREGEAGHDALLDGTMSGTLRSILISTELQKLAKIAVEDPTYVFTSIAHKMGLDFLYEAYRKTRKDGAPGVSGKTAKDYKKNLVGNLENLFLRLKSGSYIAPPVRRVWIEKSGSKKKRPLGIPEFEDKIVQRAVCMLLGAIFEKDFYDFSHGFREEHSPHDAIRDIREYCRTMGINWILDADISGFPAIAPCIALPAASMQSFDNIDHKLLMKFVKQRVNDGGIIRLLGRWLNAGVMENGGVSYSDKGTPQGGVISPLLANIFLHNVLDEWFVKDVRPRMKGRCFIIRFADDFIIGFEFESDAKRVQDALTKRFEKYGLTIHPEKTKMIEFGKPSHTDAGKRGGNTFDFLGFTHYWARSLNGNWVIKRRTSRKRVQRTISSLWEWCRTNRHLPIMEQHRMLRAKLRGHFQYFGIRCNMRSMEVVLHHALRGWKYWLSRRSRKSALSWEKFEKLLELLPLPTPKIVHSI